MRIGELADRAGVNPKTVRYYESIGLLREPSRTPSGYRIYRDDDLERLVFIRAAQHLGPRLQHIGGIRALRDHGEEPCAYVVDAAARELAALDGRIAEMTAMRPELVALLERATTGPAGPGRFCGLIQHRSATSPS